MLLVPLATGAAVAFLNGGRISFLPLLLVATIVIFWLRTPVESWMGTTPIRAQSPEERDAVGHVIIALVGMVGAVLAALFWNGQNQQLLFLGLIAAVAFSAQAVLKKLSRKTRIVAQIVGAIGLTSTAPAAYCVAIGRLHTTALLLWLANWLFAVNQIQFVQLRIHSTRVQGFVAKLTCSKHFLVTQSLVCAMLLYAWGVHMLPGLALLAFAPALARSIAWFFSRTRPLVVRRLGWTELAHAIAFGTILVAGFSLHL
jgi:YwiC-like protein